MIEIILVFLLLSVLQYVLAPMLLSVGLYYGFGLDVPWYAIAFIGIALNIMFYKEDSNGNN